MSLSVEHKYFASVLSRILASEPELTAETISEKLGFRQPIHMGWWLSGSRLPDLDTVVRIANLIEWPLDDLLVSWLADQAPQHVVRFRIIAAQLVGPRVAEDLLSGAPAEAGTTWLNLSDPPMTAAEVVLEMEEGVPTEGVFRNNRR